MKRLFILILTFWALTLTASAQLSGIVLDSRSGDTLAFASIAYKGHKIARSADIHGRFTIERHDGWVLTVSAVGYQSKNLSVNSKLKNNVVVKLKPDNQQLKEVVVKSKKKSKYSRKNNPAVELMKKVIEHKKLTDLSNKDFYQYNKYQKLTLALNEITPEMMESEKFQKRQWLLDQIEMCPQNNKLILPISVDETVTQHIYRKSPKSEKTIIKGENSTGINDLFQTGDILTVAIKDVFTDINIYDDEVRLLQYPFTSPIGKGAISFYRFYITDTLYVDNDQCIQLDFVPNNLQDFGFRGQIFILNDSSYQVKRCVLTIPKKSDVNYVENMQCTQEFTKLPTGEWVLTVDDMFVELKINRFLNKFLVQRTTRMSDYAFDDLPKQLFRGQKRVLKDSYAQMQGEDFWKKYRQVELTKSENSMDQFIKHIEDIKGFKYIIFGLKAIIENFVETGNPSKIDIGPVNTILSHNFYDGLRTRASAQTTANLSKHWFFKGYYAHGWKTKNNYYDAEVIYSFNKKEYLPREFPKQTLTFSSSRDVALPSDKFIQTDKDNVFTAWKVFKIDKMFLYNRQDLNFEFEQEWGLKLFADFKTEQMTPVGNIEFRPVGTDKTLKNIRYTEATAGIRYAPGETFINTKQRRLPINLDAPVFRLQHTMGFKGFLGGEYKYNFSEAEIYKRFWMKHNWGKIDIRIKAGAQWDKVPYPLLIMPVANLSYIKEDQSFNLINNMEFLNDRYMSAEVSWDFNGKLFNRIPLLRNLKLREFIGAHILWGNLTDKNNPDWYMAQGLSDPVVMGFPMGCYKMDPNKPYWELVLGIHNIFKILHVEYVRRMNYMELPTAKRDGIRFMFRASF